MLNLLATYAILFHGMHIDVPSTPSEWAWKTIGVLSQAVFGGRFFLQWIHSERHRESRIPVSFWWLSIVGSVMTCAYIVHVQEWILLLGNAPQLIPYSRNLYFMYLKRRQPPETEQAAL
ncbi:MAG TPA: lipid-A-disaccharide synthase N-terminal domain-containing protein [Tepidisphaeraceae bacterium]|nr:lipid-A-disaccharide synthase N-terminal domain-containing protein [Tepidisphaeraceae bacterium]